MLTLLDIVNRTNPPTPWAEGGNIPRKDPGFGKRMLTEHLCQESDRYCLAVVARRQHRR